ARPAGLAPVVAHARPPVVVRERERAAPALGRLELDHERARRDARALALATLARAALEPAHEDVDRVSARTLVDAAQDAALPGERHARLAVGRELARDHEALALRLVALVERGRAGGAERAAPLLLGDAVSGERGLASLAPPRLEREHVALQLARLDAAEDAGT